jgi:outer membrane biosynthesis protein TonB
MDKRALFWLSGAGSLFIYSALITLLVFNFANQAKKIELSGDSIAVDLLTQSQIQQQVVPQKEIKETKPEPIKETKPVQKEEKASEQIKRMPPPPESTIDTAKNILKNFSKIQDQKNVKHISTPQQSQPVQSNARQLLSSLTLKRNAPAVTFSGGPGKSNEYLSRVAGIIKAGWNPYKSDIGLSAVIYVSIKSDGSFDFSIKKYSPNGDFNSRLSAYLNDLKSRGLPPPDDGKSVSVEFNFIAKE